ncbi:MAG: hypothetical protein GY835_27140 [bacterium]|nr:hypothetical protein [bacterium]
MGKDNLKVISDNNPSLSPFNLGDWLVEPALNRISNERGAVQLSPRNMRVLCCLARQPGRVVSRPELFDTIWHGVVVGEEVLTGAISELRQTLSDDPRCPRFIETIRKGGYRLIGPVVPIEDPLLPVKLRPRAVAPSGLRPISRGGYIGLAAIIVLMSCVWALIAGRSTTTYDSSWQTVPLTSLAGQERYPTLSPDGSRVAYIRRGFQRKASQLYLRQCGTTNEILLSESENQFSFTAWSPDGAAIAFVVLQPEQAVLRTVPSLGGVCVDLANLDGRVRGIDWSPDGRYLAVSLQSTGQSADINFLDLETKQWSSPGSLRDTDTHEICPAFSPSGTTLAFVRIEDTGREHVFTLDLGSRGAGAERLTDRPATYSSLDWLPDGQTLVASASTRDHHQIWRIHLSNGAMEPQQVGQRHVYSAAAASTAPGLVMASLDLDYDLAELDLRHLPEDTSACRLRSVLSSTWIDGQAAFSPRTGKVAFTSDRSGELQIYLSAGAGSELRPITRFQDAMIWNLFWSADERFLFFMMNCDLVPAYYSLEIVSGTQRILPHTYELYDLQRASGDGNWFYGNRFENDEVLFGRVSLDGKTWETILPGRVQLVYVSVTGDSLQYFKPDRSQLYSLTQNTEAPARSLPFDLTGLVRYASAGSDIYALSTVGESSTLYRWGNTSGGLDTLGHFDARIAGPIAIAPDHSRLLATVETRRDLDLLLIPDFH